MTKAVGADADHRERTCRSSKPSGVTGGRPVMWYEKHVRAQRRKLPLCHGLDVSRQEQRPITGRYPQHDGAVVV